MMKPIKTPRFLTDKKIITPLLTKLIRQDNNLDREAITCKKSIFTGKYIKTSCELMFLDYLSSRKRYLSLSCSYIVS